MNSRNLKDEEEISPAIEGFPAKNHSVNISIMGGSNPIYKDKSIENRKTNEYCLLVSLENSTPKRSKSISGVDIVCLIDTSGSMAGDKMKIMKASVRGLINTCTERDRISIVTFNYSAERHCHFLKCNESGKETLREILKEIKPEGGTNIYAGIQTAVQTLLNRKTKNDSASLFLISDGPDTCALKSTLKFFEKSGLGRGQFSPNSFTINTFGYGEDHDAELLKQLSDSKNGRFYMLENIQDLKPSLIDAYRRSAISKSGELLVKIKTNLKVKQFLQGSCCLKTEDGIKIFPGQLGLSQTKKFTITFELPSDESFQPFFNAELFMLQRKDEISVEEFEKVSSADLQDLVIKMPENEVERSLEKSELLRRSLRVEFYFSLIEALGRADQREYKHAEEIISSFKNGIEKNSFEKISKEFLKIDDVIASVPQRVYLKNGRNKLYELANQLSDQI